MVTSHISDKASKRILTRVNQTAKNMAHPKNDMMTYQIIGAYNAFVMGVHQYYSLATEVNKDFHRISFHVNRTLKSDSQSAAETPAEAAVEVQGNPGTLWEKARS